LYEAVDENEVTAYLKYHDDKLCQKLCKLVKVKGKGRTLGIAPHSRLTSHLRGAQVHGSHQAASHIPAFIPS